MAIKFSDITGGGIPFGNNAGRPANPGIGKLYSNGEEKRLELYTATGWQNIVSETPGVVSISGNYLESSATNSIDITGTNFTTGAVASAIGNNGLEVNASSTTVNSIVSVTAVFSGLSAAYEPYDIKITNTSNLFGLLPDALYINQSPIWQTSAGSLGTFNEQVTITLSAISASDPESTTITYALANGSSLPSGITLNSSTGVISGTLPDIASDVTYTFTINATDGLNYIPRTFSITSMVVTPTVEYLVVAGGGGGGGGSAAGGGGSGGFRTGTLSVLPTTIYSLSVGNGGLGKAGNTNGGERGGTGQNSVFSSITSLGGGGGGGEGAGQQTGGSGGSGGGACYQTGQAPGTGTSGQGNNGGYGNTGYWGGGGGGAGASGGNASYGTSSAGAGGAGLSSAITGVTTWYAGGGGGATQNDNLSGGAGGQGGGGQGAQDNATGSAPSTGGVSGTPNTGGGGGGNPEGSLRANVGNGGSGIVVLAYPNTYPNISTISNTLTYTLDTTTRSGYRVYRFTAGSGTITF